ncbi:MAG: GIY-YIG nuclease family protein [Halanaerobiales bacterium]
MKIIDLFDLRESEIEKTKIHFATGNITNDEALKEFLKGNLEEWQAWQNKKNFERKYILTVVYLNSKEWLYAGIYEVIGIEENFDVKGRYKYKTVLTDKGKDYIGRLVIGFNKIFRQSYPYCENYIDKFELIEIRRNKYQILEFPGYENVNIRFSTLKLIIETENRSWKSALSSVQGIYLISDQSSGKLYVGAAYGEDNFWQRWSAYIKNGHGNNIELKEVAETFGYEYFNNFSYSIIEIFKNTTDINEILQREVYWKNILLTRQFGYNKN